MKMIRGPWFILTETPTKSGDYELLPKTGGKPVLVAYGPDGWAKSACEFDAWRGVILPDLRLPLDELAQLRIRHKRQVSRYRSTILDTHSVAAESALWLARYFVSLNQKIRAYRYYLIAHGIDKKLLHEMDLRWQKGFHETGMIGSRVQENRLTEREKVARYFDRHGGHPSAAEIR